MCRIHFRTATAHAATVLVTGSNRGLGLEFVRQYAADGWTVIAHVHHSDDAVPDGAVKAVAELTDPHCAAAIFGAADGLPPIALDPTDNLLAQLDADPQPFEFLIGSRGARFDMAADGSVVVDAYGAPLANNATGTAYVNTFQEAGSIVRRYLLRALTAA